jgi:hypothetical protein
MWIRFISFLRENYKHYKFYRRGRQLEKERADFLYKCSLMSEEEIEKKWEDLKRRVKES